MMSVGINLVLALVLRSCNYEKFLISTKSRDSTLRLELMMFSVLFSAGDMNFSLLIAGSFVVLIPETGVFTSDHKVALRRATEIISLDFRRDLGNKVL